MDDTTIFRGENPPAQQPVNPPPPPPSYYQEEERGEGGSKVSAVIKLLLGLLVVSIVFFLIFIFVLPNFGTKEEKLTLNYWGLFENEEIMNNLISDFEKENPNIDVVYERQDIKQYREKLTTRIANGTGPDIFRFHNTWVTQLSDTLLPLPSDVMSVSEFKKVFYPVAQQDLVKSGAVLGVPLEIDTLALYINSDHIKAQGLTPPVAWTDFINVSRNLTVKDQNARIITAGAGIGTYDNINYAPDLISLLLVQNGVPLYNISQEKAKAADAINFYTSFSTLEGNVWDQTLDSSLLSFSKGNLAMYFGYLRDFFTIKELNSNLLFEIAPVPQLPERKLNIASYWVEGASVKSKNQKESLLFLTFLSKKETQDKLYKLQIQNRGIGQIPARSDLGDSLANDSLTLLFAAQAKDAASTFFVDGTFDNGLNSQMNSYLAEAINSILGGASSDTALDTLIQKVTEGLASN